MSRASFGENHAMDAGMSRAASRAGSISTLWSSAEVPLCLDPRVQPSSDTFDLYPSRGHSIAGSISRHSARSSQISMDIGRLSIDIPDEYPRRPDSIRLTPPRASASTSASASNSGSSPSSRMPSFNIGTIDENRPMQSSSPISHFPYQPPSLGAQHRVLSSRFSEDTIDEPHIPHSSSQGTFGAQLSVPRKSSGMSDVSAIDSSRSSSMQDTTPIASGRTQAPAQAPSDLYHRAYRFFDKEYSVESSTGSLALASSSAAYGRVLSEEQRPDRPSLVGSDVSHEGSLPSCSRSLTSTQASSSDSASAWSAEDALSRSNAWGPVIVATELSRPEVHLTPVSSQHDKRSPSSSGKSDGLSIPSLPSLPSCNSTLTATRANPAGEDGRRRPSTADVYSQASRVSPHTLSNLPLPPMSPGLSPTEPVRYQVQSYNIAAASSPAAKASGNNASAHVTSRSTTSRLLRTRGASTPKLRQDPAPFSSGQALHVQHPVPPVPGRFNNSEADRRPSTAQMDGRAPFFGRRFRSRTLGETDRTDAAHMQAASGNATSRAGLPTFVSPQRPLVLSSLSSAAGTASMISQRHPSQVSAFSSDLHSPLHPMLPTPGSSICSASSPATTNSSLPVTPRTATTPSRPKSRGTSASKTGGAGWASYLQSGLTLHLEGDGRACQINMTYLAYDPFGRPEQLVEGTEAARVLTPKRPKSRGDKDQEAEQSGTLEFGEGGDESRSASSFTVDLGRKSEGSALLKHLTVGEDTKADLLTRQASLSLTTLGTHQVSGYERKGRLAWKLAYRVEADGGYGERRRLVPLRFSCSATLLNPERARKSRLLNLVKKQMVPTLASKAVAGGDILDSPRSASHGYDEGIGAALASPASSHHSNRQLTGELQQQQQSQQQRQQPTSPVRRSNGVRMAGIGSAYNSPLRQVSRTAASATSITSADSSFCSQPSTPGRDAAQHDTTIGRMHVLQASPVSAQFGQPNSGLRQLRSFASASTGASVAPALQLDLGQPVGESATSGKRLHDKASVASLSVSSLSSGSVQLAKPMMINGRKLIPISLPAGLARRNRIDPALLQANVVASPSSAASAAGVEERQRSTSMHSSASSSEQSQHRRGAAAGKQSMACLLSNQPRTAGGTASSRPPTASETIKLEYLARTASESHFVTSPTTDELSPSQPHGLRHQKSFGGAILTPSSFADRERRRHRSRTNEDGGHMRPFTADAWGESQYPTREQQMRAMSQQHHARQQVAGSEVSFGSSVESGGRRRTEEEGAGFKPLPIPPRPQSRPRTAQTITVSADSRYQMPLGVRS